MAVACGVDFSNVVTAEGRVYCWGAAYRRNELGIAGDFHQGNPEIVWFVETDAATGAMYNAPVVMVSTGQLHSGAVTDDGAVWTWGANTEGQLGQGTNTRHGLVPVRLGMMQHFAGSPAVMVACGGEHTLVLTARGHIWSTGEITDGLMLMGQGTVLQSGNAFKRVEGVEAMVMVACGISHCMAVGADGTVWTWGSGSHGRLGHGDVENRCAPAPLPRAAFAGMAVVFVAAGGSHSVAVTVDDILWVWGANEKGQLGLGDCITRLAPVHLAASVFCRSPLLTVGCGTAHTLVVTKNGIVWSSGAGVHRDAFGIPFLYTVYDGDYQIFRRLETLAFNHERVVSVAAGPNHSVVVTDNGSVYEWGSYNQAPRQPTHMPTLWLDEAACGRCRDTMPPEDVLALAMATQLRLGTDSPAGRLPLEVIQRVVGHTVGWPELARGVQMHQGLIRLMGGGLVSRWGASTPARGRTRILEAIPP